MRALAVVSLGTAIALGQAPGVSYAVSRSTGDHDFLFSFRQSAQPALTAPRDNKLSDWKPLPFAWEFFGAPVTGYFVSDNGYLTFDKNASRSESKRMLILDESAPTNSIFAYWTDLKLDAGQNQWTNSVWTATLGEAPSRVHIVYWMSLTPAGAAPGSAALSFLVALYENGDFEIVHTAARTAGPLSGIVGAINANGSVRVGADKAGIDFPAVGFGGEDDVAYRFKKTTR
jgi:hypothetical protein